MLGLIIVLLAALPVAAYEGGPRPQPLRNPKALSAANWASIRAEHERQRQAAFAVPGGHKARNYAQQWTTHFDGRGFDVKPDSKSWEWGSELLSYGYPGQQKSISNAHASSDGPSPRNQPLSCPPSP